MAKPDKVRKEAKRLYLLGISGPDVAAKLNVNEETVYRWKREDKWERDNAPLASAVIQERLLAIGQSKTKFTKSDAAIMKNLAVALKSVSGIEEKSAKQASKAKKKRELMHSSYSPTECSDLESRMLDSLYPYQREFWKMDEGVWAKMMLKSRQIGMSYSMGHVMPVRAVTRKRDQICVSASQDQAFIVRRHAEDFCEKLGLTYIPDGDKSIILPGGARCWFLPSNARTIQGYSGDLYLDEFAWHLKPRRIYEVIMASCTVGDPLCHLLSTPYDEAGFFGELYHSQEGKYPFVKYSCDINRAIADGHKVNLDRIRSMYDEETFAIMYLCKFFSDAASLLSVQCVQAAIDENCEGPTDRPVSAGTDVGRHHDLTATCLAERDKDGVIWTRGRIRLDNVEWDDQKDRLVQMHEDWRVRHHYIDKTGMGDWLGETMQKRFPGIVKPISFTMDRKERMALALTRLMQAGRVKIPNDREMKLHLHAIKRVAGSSGFHYDAARNEEIKHADWFWALAMACIPHSPHTRTLSTSNIDAA